MIYVVVGCLVYLAVLTGAVIYYIFRRSDRVERRLLYTIDDLLDRKNSGVFNDYVWARDVKKQIEDKYFPDTPTSSVQPDKGIEVPKQIHRAP